MLGYYYYDYSYFVFMLPAIIFSIWAQMKVNFTFKRYEKIRNERNLTGKQAALRVLQDNGITNVKIEYVNGRLSDHYDPRTNVIRLSDAVYNSTSVSAIGVAAHEAGHAVQYANGYKPMEFRGALIPVAQIGSNLSIPLIIAGFFIPTYYTLFVTLGIVLFSFAVLFQLVTLPVEIDASKRAIVSLKSGHLLNDDEVKGAKKVLTAAAMTYLAATVSAILSLVRLILIYGRRDDR